MSRTTRVNSYSGEFWKGQVLSNREGTYPIQHSRDQRFWIFPHPEMLEAVRARAESILAQVNPIFAPPPGMDLKL